MKRINNFKGRVVVITGAASGMGRSYAKAFAKEGALLALCDYDEKGLNDTISMLSDVKVCSFAFDISDKQAVEGFAQKVKEELGPAYILINNAGIEGSAEPVWATNDDFYQRVMDVNYFGVVYGTRAFLAHMLDANEGAIVNVSSIFGLIGTPNNSDYCASKFAVRGFTEALMVELQASNIQVHLLDPGGIATNIARSETSRQFSNHFLTTSPDDVARYVMKSIKQNKKRMVFGNQASKAYWGSKLLSLSVACKLAWSEMKDVIDLKYYRYK